MDELITGMRRVNITGDVGMTRENERLKRDKIAVVTIGRWQPPHAGHLELIDGTYDKVKKFHESGFKKTDGFIWLAPRPDEKNVDVEIDGDVINKNPLYLIDKWIYLNYMIPLDQYGNKLKFLHITDIDNDINQKVFRDDKDNASFLTHSHDLRGSVKETELSESQKVKYNLLFKYGKENFDKFKKRTVKISTRYRSKSPSTTCINFLKTEDIKNYYY